MSRIKIAVLAVVVGFLVIGHVPAEFSAGTTTCPWEKEDDWCDGYGGNDCEHGGETCQEWSGPFAPLSRYSSCEDGTGGDASQNCVDHNDVCREQSKTYVTTNASGC